MDGVTEAYRAPIADEERPVVIADGRQTDYVVSTGKLATLYTATFGLYSIYWFSKHWSHQKALWGLNIRPLARGFFSPLFAVQLFKQLDTDARNAGHAPSWSPVAHGTVFIVVNVLARLLDKLGSKTDEMNAIDFAALLLPMLGIVPLIVAQKVVNVTVGDPEGSSNSRLGVGGVVLLLVGSGLWLLIAVGAFL